MLFRAFIYNFTYNNYGLVEFVHSPSFKVESKTNFNMTKKNKLKLKIFI